MRFLLYSHDGVGLGHIRRNLSIASELASQDPEAAILLVTGSNEVHRFQIPEKASILKLPGIKKNHRHDYAPRSLNVSRSELHRLRSGLLASAVENFAPDVLLVDKHPLGVNGELKEALAVMNTRDVKIVLGLRDILDDPEKVRAEWKKYDLYRSIEDLYDSILIYGNEEIVDPRVLYAFTPKMVKMTRFCGYVVTDPARENPSSLPTIARGANDKRRVLAVVGGGEDGSEMLHTFMDASQGAPWNGIAITGPLAKKAGMEELLAHGHRSGVEVHGYVDKFWDWLRPGDLLVCMGGYNTLTEAAFRKVATLCIPRTKPRLEQFLRASAFERAGMLRMLTPGDDLTERMKTAIFELSSPPKRLESITFTGAQQTAKILRESAASNFNHFTVSIHENTKSETI